MAAHYGVSRRTIERWVAGTSKPRGANAERLRNDAIAVQTTPRGRKRRANTFRARGSQLTGFDAVISRTQMFEIRGSDAIRARPISVAFTGTQAARLAEAETDDDVRNVVAEAIADYMNGGGYVGFTTEDFDFSLDDVSWRTQA
jgi:hypothetical protein